MLKWLPIAISVVGTGLAQAQVARPPQFVLLAYDGSYNNSVWQSSRQYSQVKRNAGVDTRFTYFINPVYLLAKCPASATNCVAPSYTRSDYYQAPGFTGGVKNVGSAIGWGDDAKDISTRIENMNAAYSEGHEIGSHAVGHWNGSTWTKEEWRSEFNQFNRILDVTFQINKLPSSARFGSQLLFRNSITGFRAPQLGFNDNLYQTLPEFGIQYDTSLQSAPNYWPEKNKYGTWNFPLGAISNPGTGRTLPSMDFNFCVLDSIRLKAKDPGLSTYQAPGYKANKPSSDPGQCLDSVRPEQKVELKRNMMNSYMNYFNNNYYGNRAPVHIGHHFSAWASGSYSETFFEFADRVCSMPEVKCVTYNELAQYMESLTPQQRAAFKAGQFAKVPRPKSSLAAASLNLEMRLVMNGDKIEAMVFGRDSGKSGLTKSFYVKGVEIKTSSLALSQISAKPGETLVIRAVLKNTKGEEVQSATQKLMAFATKEQSLDPVSVEMIAASGHLSQAHEGEQDVNEFSTRGH